MTPFQSNSGSSKLLALSVVEETPDRTAKSKSIVMDHLTRNVPALLQVLRIAECGSINKAAEILNVSQSALTRSLGRLEAELGVSLFERSGKGVRLTAFGESILSHARSIEAQLRSARRDIIALKAEKTHPLRIGATPLITHQFLLPALGSLQDRFSNLRIRLVEGTRPNLLGKLRLGRLDCVLSTFPFDQQEDGLLQKSAFDLDLRVVVRATHPLASRPYHNLRDLSRWRWILPRADSALYRRVENDFRRAGATFPGSVIETSSPETARALVLTTDLLAILPIRSIESEIKSNSVMVLSGGWSFEQRTVGMFVRPGPVSAPCRYLLDFLRRSEKRPFKDATASP